MKVKKLKNGIGQTLRKKHRNKQESNQALSDTVAQQTGTEFQLP